MDKRIIKTYEPIQTTKKGRPIAFWVEEFRGTPILKIKAVRSPEDVAKGSDRTTLSISTPQGLDAFISLLTKIRDQMFTAQAVVPPPPPPASSFQPNPPPPPATLAADPRPPPPPPAAPAS